MSDFRDIAQQFKHYVLADADSSMALGSTQHLSALGDPSLEHMHARNHEANVLL